MKDIGLKLREKREENGISIEEVAEDLKMRPGQIESLENGCKDDFKDVATLKYFIRDYAKYLGLDGSKILDEFNEYLFDFTSKIPIEEIENAKENNKTSKEVASPYTKATDSNKNHNIVLIVIAVIVVLLIALYVIFSNKNRNDFSSNDATYVVRR